MDKRPSGRMTGPAPRKLPGPQPASPFVGRDDEMRRLTSALTLAAEGQGGIIFLTGQPGIGKTRLARESLALAKGHGFLVLQGRAHPLEAGLSYAPFLEAFGPLLRSFDAFRLDVLVSGLPDLGRLFGGLGIPPPPFSEGLGDPSLEKVRLFEAVARLLERLTLEAPVALFVDDLHWADPVTLELLYYLVRGLDSQRVLLLASYGTDALDTTCGLRSLVGSLQRDGLAEEIFVDRLEPSAVGKLVRAILGGEAPVDLLDLLEVRAGGTPLFIEALLAALIDSATLVRHPFPSPAGKDGWVLDAEGAIALPPGVRHLILDRLERLAPTDRRVIELIAVMGDVTTHTILRAASGLDEENLIDALRRLKATGLVAEGTDGLDSTYRITHPLIQEAVYAETPGAARRRSHVAVIQALESFSQGRPDDVTRLARHYRGAGIEADPSRALTVLLAAGERARTIYANEEAARHYNGALALVREGYHTKWLADCHQALLPWLLERLGDVWERIGDSTAAIRVWNEALAELEAAGDALAKSRLRRQLAAAEWDRGHFDIANAHLRAGLAELADHEPCQELADLYFARFYIHSRAGNIAGMADTVEDLMSVAERLASPRAEAEANVAASISCLCQSDISNAREHAHRALMVSDQSREMAICCRAHLAMVNVGMRLGDHRLVRDHVERGLPIAQRLGELDSGFLLLLYFTYANFMSGNWEESLRNSTQVVALARRVSRARYLAYALSERAIILALRGNLAEAEACMSEVRMAPGGRTPADRVVLGLVDIAETALALERGQVERALTIARGWAAPIEHPPASSAVASAVLTPSFMPQGLMLLAEAQVAAGDTEGALETTRMLISLGPPSSLYLTALASRADGLARQALGQSEVAISCFARAHERFA